MKEDPGQLGTNFRIQDNYDGTQNNPKRSPRTVYKKQKPGNEQ